MAGFDPDEQLLEALSALAEVIDPVPARVTIYVRNAFVRVSQVPPSARATSRSTLAAAHNSEPTPHCRTSPNARPDPAPDSLQPRMPRTGSV